MRRRGGGGVTCSPAGGGASALNQALQSLLAESQALRAPHRRGLQTAVHHQPGWWRQAVLSAGPDSVVAAASAIQVTLGCTGTSRSWIRPRCCWCSRPPSATR